MVAWLKRHTVTKTHQLKNCSTSCRRLIWTNQKEFVSSQRTEQTEKILYGFMKVILLTYQILIYRESVFPLLHSAGWPPLSRDVSTFIWQILRKGCPGVVWLVEGAVRPAWCPVGRLPGNGVISKCCFQDTNTHTRLVVQWCPCSVVVCAVNSGHVSGRLCPHSDDLNAWPTKPTLLYLCISWGRQSKTSDVSLPLKIRLIIRITSFYLSTLFGSVHPKEKTKQN